MTNLPPNPERFVFALRSIGYKLHESVADLIDNSISAGAKNVLVRFEHDDEQVLRVAIIDDGRGMKRTELTEAMRFGAITKVEDNLGKFGLGLKLASLSHARSLSVISRGRGTQNAHGRRWTVAGIADQWRCDTVPRADCNALLPSKLGPLDLTRGGTLVLWEDLDRLNTSQEPVDTTTGRYLTSVRRHLGLVFHRFISSGQCTIYLDTRIVGGRDPRSAERVRPIDPFGYPKSGLPGAPYLFRVPFAGATIKLRAHIWPPADGAGKAPNYNLFGGAAKAQGFYIYRHKRLIQAGGWLGLRTMDTDPHLSLSRVQLELPRALEDQFHLDVQKSTITPPIGLPDAIREATTARGVSWDVYMRRAQDLYRKKSPEARRRLPCVPESGIRKKRRLALREVLNPKGGDYNAIEIVWGRAGPGRVFKVDRESARLVLSSHYRSKLQGQRGAKRFEYVKALLFMLVREDFKRERSSKSHEKALREINDVLLAMLRNS